MGAYSQDDDPDGIDAEGQEAEEPDGIDGLILDDQEYEARGGARAGAAGIMQNRGGGRAGDQDNGEGDMYGMDHLDSGGEEAEEEWAGESGDEAGHDGYGDEEDVDNEGGFRSSGRRNLQQIRSNNGGRSGYTPSNGSSYMQSSHQGGSKKYYKRH